MSGGLFDRLAGRLDDVAEPEASFAMADLLDLPDDERVVMRHVMRRAETTSIDGLAGELGLDVVDRLQADLKVLERWWSGRGRHDQPHPPVDARRLVGPTQRPVARHCYRPWP